MPETPFGFPFEGGDGKTNMHFSTCLSHQLSLEKKSKTRNKQAMLI
jgi:hypothetical protein